MKLKSGDVLVRLNISEGEARRKEGNWIRRPLVGFLDLSACIYLIMIDTLLLSHHVRCMRR